MFEFYKKHNYKRIPAAKIFSNANVDYTKLSGFLRLINEKDRRELLRDLNNHTPIVANIDIPVKFTSFSETLNYDEGVSLLFNMGFLTIMSREEIEATPNGCNLEGHASGSPMITLKLCFLEFSLKTVRICFEVLKNSET